MLFNKKRKMRITIANSELEAKHLVYIWENILKLKKDKYTLKHFKPFYVKSLKLNKYLVYYFY